MSEKKVQVEIDGASYTLVTDESEEQIKDIADYVSSKIAEVKSNKLSYDRELVLASVNIANDLYHVGNRYKNLKEDSSEAMENYPSLVENYNDIKLSINAFGDTYKQLYEMKDRDEIIKFLDKNRLIKGDIDVR